MHLFSNVDRLFVFMRRLRRPHRFPSMCRFNLRSFCTCASAFFISFISVSAPLTLFLYFSVLFAVSRRINRAMQRRYAQWLRFVQNACRFWYWPNAFFFVVAGSVFCYVVVVYFVFVVLVFFFWNVRIARFRHVTGERMKF